MHYESKRTPLTPPDPPKDPQTPLNLHSDPPYNQFSPPSYLTTHSQNPPNLHQNLKNAQNTQKCPKMPQNAPKWAKMEKSKNCKNENLPILLCFIAADQLKDGKGKEEKG